MNIAILGFGTIGGGVHEIINVRGDIGTKAKVVKILDLPQNKDKSELIVCDIKEIVEDETIDLVVETMGGLHPAHEFILLALQHGKHVVTANKAVVAAYLDEFTQAAHEHQVAFRYEASTGGGIPWLQSILKAKRIDRIDSFYGIFNGTTNYILCDMLNKEKEFDESLKDAQALGYAERDPSADIDGYDVTNKVVISCALAFNTYIDAALIPVYSMKNITFDDIRYLKAKGLALKYVGDASIKAQTYDASIMPNIFKMNSVEANIPDNYNICTLHGETIGELKFYGQGAGKLPTANAIVQDILDIQEGTGDYGIDLTHAYAYDENAMHAYLIRTDNDIEDGMGDKESYQGHTYLFTKVMANKEIRDFFATIQAKDEKALLAKIKDY